MHRKHFRKLMQALEGVLSTEEDLSAREAAMITTTYSLEMIWSVEDQGFVARCPEVSDQYIAFGETRQEATEEFEIALSVRLKSMAADGQKLPDARIIDHA